MKRAFVLALIPALAIAQDMPFVVGTIPNKGNAKITFTTYKGDCQGRDWVVYTQEDGGRVALTGCYQLVGDELFVIWSDGDFFTYPWRAMTLNPDMAAFLKRNREQPVK
jgi:hypothetical protein